MQPILFEVHNNIAFITLNRPEKLNAFNREMALLLQSTLEDCAQRKEVRCIMITGAGKGFCAGQDLAEVADPNGPGMKRILSEHYNPIIKKIKELEKPVVAAVNGVAAGAGANIALACDIVVAAANASFIQAFSKIGLIPDSGGTYTLPRLIGWQKAAALMMLGEKVPAAEAEKMGMIYKTFPADNFMEEATGIAAQLVKLPAGGLAYTKQALSSSATNTLTQQLLLEDELQQKAANEPEFKAAVAAFLGKSQAIR